MNTTSTNEQLADLALTTPRIETDPPARYRSAEMMYGMTVGLERIANFLGIDPFPEGLSDLHLNPARDLLYPSSLTPSDVTYLSDLFLPQKGIVEEFLGRPIPSWRAPDRLLRLTAAGRL